MESSGVVMRDNGLLSRGLQAAGSVLTPWGEEPRARRMDGSGQHCAPPGEPGGAQASVSGSEGPVVHEPVVWPCTVCLDCWAWPCTSEAADLPSSVTVVAAS